MNGRCIFLLRSACCVQRLRHLSPPLRHPHALEQLSIHPVPDLHQPIALPRGYDYIFEVYSVSHLANCQAPHPAVVGIFYLLHFVALPQGLYRKGVAVACRHNRLLVRALIWSAGSSSESASAPCRRSTPCHFGLSSRSACRRGLNTLMTPWVLENEATIRSSDFLCRGGMRRKATISLPFSMGSKLFIGTPPGEVQSVSWTSFRADEAKTQRGFAWGSLSPPDR